MTAKKEPHPDEAFFDRLVAAFERQLSQEEVEVILAECGGDVRRASELCRKVIHDYMRSKIVEDPTHDYMRSLSVEELIKAGKGLNYD